MGDQVERSLEETVPLLRQARKLKLLSEQELRECVRQRRDHEYAVSSSKASRGTFLRYAAFERATATKLGERAIERGLPERRARALSARAGSRVNLVYSRAIRRFKGDDALYLHYARHCVQTGSRKAAEKVFARAIAHRSDSEKVWLAAAAFHFDSCGDIKTARAISQRGLRALKGSKILWKEYFRLELAYLAKLMARRVAIGMGPGVLSREHVPEANVLHAGSPVDSVDPEVGNVVLSVNTDCPLESEKVVGGGHPQKKLSFWEGGVPYAVFRSALESAKLSASDAAEYWLVAVSVKFVPSSLLDSILRELSERYNVSDNPCLQIIECRRDFDNAAAEHVLLCAKSSASTLGSSSVEPLTQSAQDAPRDISGFLAVCESTVRALEVRAALLFETESQRPFVAATLSELQYKMEEFVKVGLDDEWLKRLKSVAMNEDKHLVANTIAADDDFALEVLQKLDGSSPASEWSTYLDNIGTRAFLDKADATVQSIRERLRSVTLGGFRNQNQEAIVLAWFSWEQDVLELRKAYQSVLSLPPVSMELLKGIISREIVLNSLESAPQPLTGTANDAAIIVRSLFKRAANLNDAVADVDFWTHYLTFERDVVRDVEQASRVHWQASRMLHGENLVSFNERVSLLNIL